MAKSLSLGYFGDGKCDKCDKDVTELLSISYDDGKNSTTFTFCQDCLSSTMGDVLENDVDSVEMLSIRAQNA